MTQSIENASGRNEFDRSAGALGEEATLRLIATLPAPEGLEERVKLGLSSGPRRGGVVAWPFAYGDAGSWTRSAGMRMAAAAAIVLLVAGGGWGVYSHIQPVPSPSAVYGPQPVNDVRGGFNAAGAKRVPQTVEGPVVVKPEAAKDKTESQSKAVQSHKQGKQAAQKKSAGAAASAQ